MVARSPDAAGRGLVLPHRSGVPDERSGAYSILVGVAANRCFETGETVRIADLVPNLTRPDYPRMPARTAPVPMPPKTG